MRAFLRGLFWIGVYATVVFLPLVLGAAVGHGSGHGFIDDFAVALGFLGMAVMVLQFGLVGRFQFVAGPLGMDALLQFHRQIGYVALTLILAHPLLLFMRMSYRVKLLWFPTAPLRARFALAATLTLIALVCSSVWRRQLRLSYERWHILHGLLAAATVVLSLAHAVAVGHHMALPWQRGLWIALSGTLLGLLVWVRILRPMWRLRRPWRVTSVHAERGSAWTLELAPEGHTGLHFTPGQFGWITVGRSPFSFTQHPFSFASSAERPGGAVALTIKARGDFTKSIATVGTGTRAYIDGPHGRFTLDQREAPGFVFVAGGVGITPLISMLRTLADRGDTRPCWLFYGNRTWDTVTFREEIDGDLSRRLGLTVVHTVDQPPEEWSGERGHIDGAMLRRHLQAHHERLLYFVCGPAPMMDAIEAALLELGVPDDRVLTERFEMV